MVFFTFFVILRLEVPDSSAVGANNSLTLLRLGAFFKKVSVTKEMSGHVMAENYIRSLPIGSMYVLFTYI